MDELCCKICSLVESTSVWIENFNDNLDEMIENGDFDGLIAVSLVFMKYLIIAGDPFVKFEMSALGDFTLGLGDVIRSFAQYTPESWQPSLFDTSDTFTDFYDMSLTVMDSIDDMIANWDDDFAEELSHLPSKDSIMELFTLDSKLPWIALNAVFSLLVCLLHSGIHDFFLNSIKLFTMNMAITWFIRSGINRWYVALEDF